MLHFVVSQFSTRPFSDYSEIATDVFVPCGVHEHFPVHHYCVLLLQFLVLWGIIPLEPELRGVGDIVFYSIFHEQTQLTESYLNMSLLSPKFVG